MENPLYAKLRNKYEIGNNFISAYLTHLFETDSIDNIDVEAFDRKLASNPNWENWANYALSTNIRGREFAELLRPHLPKNANRYLDVGSAYGGFLIGFMELGLEVAGIEYNEKLVHLSQANFKDYGLEDASIKGDILDQELLAHLGKFDVITCIDVIEHVDDVPRAMKNMVDLLNPGGILVLQMPNKDSISNVMADSHYGIFGITLLKHSDARRFYFCHFPSSNMYYGMGEYYRQGYYLKMLADLGCGPLVLPPAVPTSLREKARLIPEYFSCFRDFIFKNTAPIPFDLKFKVLVRALFHVTEFVIGLGIAALFQACRPALKRRFADDAWFIIGTKLDP